MLRSSSAISSEVHGSPSSHANTFFFHLKTTPRLAESTHELLLSILPIDPEWHRYSKYGAFGKWDGKDMTLSLPLAPSPTTTAFSPPPSRTQQDATSPYTHVLVSQKVSRLLRGVCLFPCVVQKSAFPLSQFERRYVGSCVPGSEPKSNLVMGAEWPRSLERRGSSGWVDLCT